MMGGANILFHFEKSRLRAVFFVPAVSIPKQLSNFLPFSSVLSFSGDCYTKAQPARHQQKNATTVERANCRANVNADIEQISRASGINTGIMPVSSSSQQIQPIKSQVSRLCL